VCEAMAESNWSHLFTRMISPTVSHHRVSTRTGLHTSTNSISRHDSGHFHVRRKTKKNLVLAGQHDTSHIELPSRATELKDTESDEYEMMDDDYVSNRKLPAASAASPSDSPLPSGKFHELQDIKSGQYADFPIPSPKNHSKSIVHFEQQDSVDADSFHGTAFVHSVRISKFLTPGPPSKMNSSDPLAGPSEVDEEYQFQNALEPVFILEEIAEHKIPPSCKITAILAMLWLFIIVEFSLSIFLQMSRNRVFMATPYFDVVVPYVEANLSAPSAFEPNLYGLFWAGENDSFVQDIGSTSIAGYFDPNAPTVVFVAGFLPGRVSSRNFVNFNYQNNDPFFSQTALMNSSIHGLKSKGYNVGIFQWIRFADEDAIVNAEGKIWNASTSPVRMRWRKYDGSYGIPTSQSSLSTTSVSELMVAALSNALNGRSVSTEFRLVGVGLGAQLVARYCDLIMAKSETLLLPSRLVLIEPYVSTYAASYAPDGSISASMTVSLICGYCLKHSQRILSAVKTFNSSVEVIQSSCLDALNGFGFSSDILKNAVYFRIYPNYFSVFDLTGRHIAGFNYYAYSLSNNFTSSISLVSGHYSSNHSPASVSSFIGLPNPLYLQQTVGATTFSSSDDLFSQISSSCMDFVIHQ
jgi:hypothetical protein